MVEAAFPVVWEIFSESPDLRPLLQGSGLSRLLFPNVMETSSAIPPPQFLPCPCGTKHFYLQIVVVIMNNRDFVRVPFFLSVQSHSCTLPRLPREWPHLRGCQSSRRVLTLLSDTGWDFEMSVQGQELDSMVFMGPIQPRIFHGSVIPTSFFIPRHFPGGFVSDYSGTEKSDDSGP